MCEVVITRLPTASSHASATRLRFRPLHRRRQVEILPAGAVAMPMILYRYEEDSLSSMSDSLYFTPHICRNHAACGGISVAPEISFLGFFQQPSR